MTARFGVVKKGSLRSVPPTAECAFGQRISSISSLIEFALETQFQIPTFYDTRKVA